jgi:diguanylate cyclase
MRLSGELGQVQQSLLERIAGLLAANRQLEDDLSNTRSRMEAQATEIERTRLEARTDTLAGVDNRKSFDEKLQLFVAAWRTFAEPVVVALIDADHFKWINDTHGHQAGDRVICQIGAFLRKSVRAGDCVARFGGDEFAILLPNIEASTALKLMQRIVAQAAAHHFEIGGSGHCAAVTLSIGIAQAISGDTPESLLKRADDALYKAKHGGRNQVQASTDVPHQSQLAAATGGSS